jgi:hypothetical protein
VAAESLELCQKFLPIAGFDRKGTAGWAKSHKVTARRAPTRQNYLWQSLQPRFIGND